MVWQDVQLVVWKTRRWSETGHEESFILQPLRRNLLVPEQEWSDALSGALGSSLSGEKKKM